MKDQAEKLRQMANRIFMPIDKLPRGRIIKNSVSKKPRVITVTSGKGGVGKTNFTVNLALALTNFEQHVLVIDADLGMANVDVILGCWAPYNMMSLLTDDLNINDIIIDGPRGIKFLSGGSGVHELANLSQQDLEKVIKKITLFDDWADIILVDTGAGINRNVINFVMAADEVIIITTPEPTAITDAYALIKTFAGFRGTAPLKLVVNRVMDQDEGQVVVEKLVRVAQRFLNLSISELGFVYEDRLVMQAVKKQIPLLIAFPDAVSSQCIDHIAYEVAYGEKLTPANGMKGFFIKFLDMMR
jgi:flagellar biosynthesis protein FlhG